MSGPGHRLARYRFLLTLASLCILISTVEPVDAQSLAGESTPPHEAARSHDFPVPELYLVFLEPFPEAALLLVVEVSSAEAVQVTWVDLTGLREQKAEGEDEREIEIEPPSPLEVCTDNLRLLPGSQR